MSGLERWDDLRIVLAVVRGGSFAAAARRLQVDPTTVTRRIRALEKTLGSPLFERDVSGLQPTDSCQVLVTCATACEAHFHDASRRLEQTDDATGSVRVSLPELLAIPWMTEFARFSLEHPDLQLDLVTSDDFQSLQRREADLAVRVTHSPPEHLIATELGYLSTAVYASTRWSNTDFEHIPWIGWDLLEAQDGEIERHRKQLTPDSPYSMWVNSYGMLLNALQEGVGMTYLPCLAGDALPGIHRRTDRFISQKRVWLLVHPDLRRSRRVRAVRAFLQQLTPNVAPSTPRP